MVENSEIPQVTEGQPRYTAEVPQFGEISPKQQAQEGHVNITPESAKTPPRQTDEGNPPHFKANMNEISAKETSDRSSGNGRRSKGTNTQQEHIQ